MYPATSLSGLALHVRRTVASEGIATRFAGGAGGVTSRGVTAWLGGRDVRHRNAGRGRSDTPPGIARDDHVGVPSPVREPLPVGEHEAVAPRDGGGRLDCANRRDFRVAGDPTVHEHRRLWLAAA